LMGFSHGVSGIAWALMNLSAATGRNEFRSTALRALDYEHSLYSTAARNWPDLRAAANRQIDKDVPFPNAWCHGAPGIGLARLHLLKHCDNARLRSDLEIALHTTMTGGFGDNHSLCHGDLGNLDFLLQVSNTTGRPELARQLTRISAMVANSIQHSGWFCGTALRVESPGLMTGLAGIGYGLLRLATSGKVPSVLTLESPRGMA
jgi:lantibiotic modifying enzyme